MGRPKNSAHIIIFLYLTQHARFASRQQQAIRVIFACSEYPANIHRFLSATGTVDPLLL
jgi:hypothetical protein